MANGMPALEAEPVADSGYRARPSRLRPVSTKQFRGEPAVIVSTEHDAMMTRFVHDYLDLLDERLLTIHTALTDGNLLAAEVAMLSLESSSTMVGATSLAHIVRNLRAAVVQGDWSCFPELTHALDAEASNVPGQLLGVYRH